MRGVLGVTLLFLRAERFQQFGLLPAALFVLCAGPVIVALWPCQSAGVSTAILVLNIALLPALGLEVMVAGVNFRAAAAFRALTFAPYSRLRLALGALLVVVLAASLVTASAALKRHFVPATFVPWGTLSGTFGGTLAVSALAVMMSFLACGGSMWSRVGWPALFFLGGPLLAVYAGQVTQRLGLSVVGVVELVALVAVSSFVVWYSRARIISPPQLNQVPSNALGVPGISRRETIGASVEQSTNIYLLGQPTVLRACLPWLLLAAGNNYLYVFGIPGVRRSPIGLDSSIAFLLSLMMVLTCGALFPASTLHRTRALWIRGGSSRLELFHKVEKLSLCCLAWTAAPLLPVWLFTWRHQPTISSLYMLTISVSTGLVSAYLSLFDVRRNSQFNPYLVSFAIVTWVLVIPGGTLSLFSPDDPWEFLLPAAEFAGLFTLRRVVQRRWQHIDWLICRPPPSGSQRLRVAR